MNLTESQRADMGAWLEANMTARHTATWAANELAPLLGLGIPPLPWEVLHPLADEVRAWTKASGRGRRDGRADHATYGSLPKVKADRRGSLSWADATCAVCGRRFEKRSGSHRYCSARCRQAAQLGRMRERKGVEAREVTCASCGRTFESARRNARNCPECARAAKAPKVPKARRCPECGRAFTPKLDTRVYCSSACQVRHGERARAERRKRERAADGEKGANPCTD